MIVESGNLAWSINRKNNKVVSLEFFGIVDTPEGNFCEVFLERYYSEEIGYEFRDATLYLHYKTPHKKVVGVALKVPNGAEEELRDFLNKLHRVEQNSKSGFLHIKVIPDLVSTSAMHLPN